MKNKGFIRVAAAVPQLKVADLNYNVEQLIASIRHAAKESVSLLVFPELALSSVSCGDLYQNGLLLERAKENLAYLLKETEEAAVLFVLGLPISIGSAIYNVAAVAYKGKLLGLVPKTTSVAGSPFCSSLPETEVHYKFGEERVILAKDIVFETPHFSFSICFSVEDSLYHTEADLVCCLSNKPLFASPSMSDIELLQGLSQLKGKAHIYVSPGFGESTTDQVYAGAAAIIDAGEVLVQNELFQLSSSLIFSEVDLAQLRALQRLKPRSIYAGKRLAVDTDLKELPTLNRRLDAHPFLAEERRKDIDYAQAYEIQALGLIQRLLHIRCEKLILGVSGGLDSTLALLVCMKVMDKLGFSRQNIIGVTMPGFGTTGRTYQNAQVLMQKMGITVREISIKEACLQHFKDIGHDAQIHDITFENSQARERTQLLMDIANQENALVVGTGDLSELALGWATYNGDHMSMYAVNASVPKTLVQDLVRWVAVHETDQELSKTLLDILDTPISPELTPASEEGEIQQKTEDLVGPYELHDYFLYHTLKYAYSPKLIYERAQLAFAGQYSSEIIKYWLKTFYRRFFMQQFKRSCMPDGPNVTGLSLSPRGAWTMPSDASAALWLDEVESL